MKKIALALALFAFVGAGVVNAANLGDDKNKKECSTGEKKSCCKAKSSAKACGTKADEAKADAKTSNDGNASAKAEVKKEETKK